MDSKYTVKENTDVSEGIQGTVNIIKSIPKKRNGKLISYLLLDTVGCSICFPILMFMGEGDFSFSVEYILIWLLCVVFAVLFSWRIISKAEKGKAVAEWFRCLGTGFVVAFLISLIFMTGTLGIAMGSYQYIIEDGAGHKFYAKSNGNGIYEDTYGKIYKVER